ncbi:GIY-YIG nuclease family protein [Eubacterium aggregans]|uniref:GIY-YIG nuclease family protein n=1 Tax=Eubacterium aggregans TaxID=81409 RepID=UPI003F4140D9
MGKHFVYILHCADDTLYTGWTTDLHRRIRTHNQGNGAKYTKNRLPVILEYYEVFNEKGDAISREAAIKKLSRFKKLELIAQQQGESD